MEVRFFETPAEWRAWLEEHHATATEVEVGFRRKASGLPTSAAAQAALTPVPIGQATPVPPSPQ